MFELQPKIQFALDIEISEVSFVSLCEGQERLLGATQKGWINLPPKNYFHCLIKLEIPVLCLNEIPSGIMDSFMS